MSGSGYKDLVVWQKAMDMAKQTYNLTHSFPDTEKYGLISQMRRSAVSLSSNIAEGSRRGDKEFQQFLRIAFGFGSELETQLELAKKLQITTSEKTKKVEDVLTEVMKMLKKLLSYKY